MSPLAVLNHSIWYTGARIRTVYGRSAGRSITVLLGSLFFVSMGMGIGALEQQMNPEGQLGLRIGMMFLVGYVTLLRWFIPAYQVKLDKVPPLLPVSPGARHALDLITDLLSPSQLMLYLLPLGMLVFSQGRTWALSLAIISVQWSTHLLRRCIQVALERRLRYGLEAWLAVVLAITSISTIWYTFQHLLTDQLLWLPHLIFVQLLLLDVALHRLVVGTRTSTGGAGGKWGGFSLLWAHKPTRQMLIFSWVFKLIFLYGYGLGLYPPGSKEVQFIGLDGIHPLIYIMIGPWVLASYIFNNTWGYYTGLWLQVHQTSGNPRTIVSTQLRLALPAYLVDTALSLGFILVLGLTYGIWAGQLFGFWLVGAITLVPLMVVASLRGPRILPTSGWFSMRQRTSQLYGWIALLLLLLQMLVFVHWLAWVLVVLGAAALWWWMFDTLRDYPRLAHELYAKLFKPDGK